MKFINPIKASLLLCLGLSAFTQADESQAYMAKLSPESLLLDITSTTNHLIAVGERGHILRSDDGQQWQQQAVPSIATLTAVDFIGEHGWAVGHDASILHSADGGKSWQQQYFAPELEKPLLDVLFFDEQQGIAIGAYGLFLRTLDGGNSWQKEPHVEFLNEDDQAYLADLRAEDEALYEQELSAILPHLNRVNRVGNTLYLAGEMGLLARSDDLGKSWQVMDIDYYGSFFDINQTVDGSILAAGLRGNLFRLDEEQWYPVQHKGKATFNTIITDPAIGTVVVGNNGYNLWLNGDALTEHQSASGKAILSGVYFNNQLITVTAEGVMPLSKD